MKRNKTKKTKLIAILLILVLSISIGYAALTTSLTINGNATIKKQNWGVYFNNVKVKEGSISGDKVTTAPTTTGTTTTELNWEVSMDTPGEFYEYNVDIVNAGAMDAMIETATTDIVTSTLTAEQQKYLDYTIVYVNGTAIEKYDKLKAGETKTITVKLLFKQDINPEDLPQTAESVHLSYKTNYVQADENAVEKYTKIPLKIGDTVNYTTTLNGQTLNNWKVFYTEGDKTYIILGDYLPNAAISDTIKTSYNLSTNGTNYVYSSTRKDLINAMTEKSNWNNLLTGTLNGKELNVSGTEQAWAMGAPDLELWVNSWNAQYPDDTLYTAQMETADRDGLKGYYIGDSASPTTTSIDLSSKTGHNNSLYFPDRRDPQLNGYWLASPGSSMLLVRFTSEVCGSYGSSSDHYAFRPVICLPTNIL